MKGAYCLIIDLPRESELRVGRLGSFRFPKGTYVYTGSGMAGIEARVSRHLKRKKKLRWHIDYLLTAARVKSVIRVQASTRVECEINGLAFQVPGSSAVVPGFGSSDCSCTSHLAFWGAATTQHSEKPHA
jgi:Uri superfamily endonuclease